MKPIEIEHYLQGEFVGYTYNNGLTAYSSYKGCVEALRFYIPNSIPKNINISTNMLRDIEGIVFFWNRVYREGMDQPELRKMLNISNIVRCVVDDLVYDNFYHHLRDVDRNHWMITQTEINKEDIDKINLKF